MLWAAVCAGLACAAALSPAQTPTDKRTPNSAGQARVAYSRLPLSFEENRGQFDAGVRFMARGQGYGLNLTAQEAILALRQPLATPQVAGTVRGDVVRMELMGANAGSQGTGVDLLPGTVNYFIGNDPAKWTTAIPTWARVRFKGVYPGVDVVYYGNQRELEYDFVVEPFADTNAIRLRFSGAHKLALTPEGDLRVKAENGAIAFHRPEIYQEFAGANGKRTRRHVIGGFMLLADNTVRFKLGDYDRALPLVIDPVLAYSTYLGGSIDDMPNAIAVDASGNAYVAGETLSPDFPVTAGAYEAKFPINSQLQASNTYNSGFVSKINATGTALIYSTYLGGSGRWPGGGDMVAAIALDTQGNAYLTGTATSPDFPITQGSFQGTDYEYENGFALDTAFVTKLNATGTALVYSTFLGGSGQGDTDGWGDTGRAIAVDAGGNAYVTGATESADFPVTQAAFQKTNGGAKLVSGKSIYGANAFVTKLNPAGSALVYSTLLGGTLSGNTLHGIDVAHGISIDSQGNAYVTGSTESTDFPVTAGAFQTQVPSGLHMGYGVGAGFAAKFNPTGSGLVYATFLTGSKNNLLNAGTSAEGVAIDTAGNAYVAGETTETDFPVTQGAFQQTFAYGGSAQGSSWSGFVTKLNSTGSAEVYSTYLGGTHVNGYATSEGEIASIAVDAAGNATVAGATGAVDFPTTPGAVARPALNLGYTTAFATRLNAHGTGLIYSTYLSGSSKVINGQLLSDPEAADAVVLDHSGNAYVAGYTSSPDFPVTTGALQATNKAGTYGSNGFVAMLSIGTLTASYLPSATRLVSSANPQAQGSQVTFTATVGNVNGGGNPTGSVTFYVDGVLQSTAPVESSEQAAWSSSTISAGPHVVNALYSGDATFAGSGGQLTQTIKSPVSQVIASSGSNQSSVYATPFANPIVVVLEDSSNHPVPNIVVAFSGAGLKFSSSSATSDANGKVQVTVTPIATGFLTATASVQGVSATATFSLSAGAAPLTVTASPQTMTYGSKVPSLTYTITGFVNGDTQASATTGAPNLSTTATSKSAAGSYTITTAKGTLAATNYLFTMKNSALTVTKALLTVAGDKESMTYGGTVPALAFTITGFLNGDTKTSATTGSPKLSTTVTSKTPAGTYPIAVGVGTLLAKNYSFKFVAGALTVSKATLKIVVNNATRKYGTANPTLTGTVTGILNSDAVTVTYSTTTTTSSPVGTYPITAAISGTGSGNYTPAVTKGTLTITQAVAAAPTFTPAAGTYTVAQSVTLTDTSSGVTFYYTTNGTLPGTSSTKYTGPIKVTASETLKAIALSTNYSQSAVASAAYVIK